MAEIESISGQYGLCACFSQESLLPSLVTRSPAWWRPLLLWPILLALGGCVEPGGPETMCRSGPGSESASVLCARLCCQAFAGCVISDSQTLSPCMVGGLW